MIWEIDPTHSQVSFSIRVMGVSTTKGRFNALPGQLSIDEQNPASSWVEAEVGAASIDTHNRLRDAHLRSAAFFAVKQYPTIVFESTNVGHVSGQDYKVTGNLTLLGVTKPVIFDVTYHGQRTMMDARTGLTAKAGINRHDLVWARAWRYSSRRVSWPPSRLIWRRFIRQRKREILASTTTSRARPARARAATPPVRSFCDDIRLTSLALNCSLFVRSRCEVLLRGGARSVFVAAPSHTSSREDEVQPVVAETRRLPVRPGRDAHR